MRYTLESDDDGHHFIVPVKDKDGFDLHLQSVYGEWEEEYPMPEDVISIGGSPNRVQFSDPIIL